MKKHKKRLRNFRKKKFSITTQIILINILVFIFVNAYLLMSTEELNFENLGILNYFTLTPQKILQGEYLPSLFLHMFTHTIFFHLAVNMFVLFSLGNLCEKIIGRKRYIWFYISAGLFAGILSVVLSGFLGNSKIGQTIFGDPSVPAVGASGAIFGIAALLMMLIPRLKFSIIFLPFFSFPAYAIIPAAVLIMWVISIIFNLPIGNVAHFGGFLFGVFYGLYLRTKYKEKL